MKISPRVTGTRAIFRWKMLRERKEQIVAALAGALSRSTIIVMTGYQGATAKQMNELRRELTKIGVEYHVVKNTLLRLALEKAERTEMSRLVDGPIALAFGYDDVVLPVKALNQHIKSAGLPLAFKGGLLGKRLLAASEVMSLANLPPREVLIARLLGQLQAPLANLNGILSAPMQRLMGLLEARIQKIST